MEKSAIVDRAWQVMAPVLSEQGYELVEVEFTGQLGTRVLRVYIDKPGGGISLDDCTRATHLLNPVLDLEDFVPEHYLLEVSSPGIDRPVRKLEDFDRFNGEEAKVVTFAPLEGRKRFTGILRGTHNGLIVLECEGKTFEIAPENLKKANLNR